MSLLARRFAELLALVWTLAWPHGAIGQQLLIPGGSTWRLWKGTTEASNPIDRWRQTAFDDSAWTAGPAPFHYGDGLPTGTPLNDMRGKYTCIFLRRSFVLTNVAEVRTVRLRADYDDGFVAWINAVEVARSGVQGEPGYDDVATTSHEGGSPVTFTPTKDPSSYLVAGTNVLAVQAFNHSLAGSTDFRFDTSLVVETPDDIAPSVAARLPAEGDVGALSQITVVFSEPVVGVAAADLLVNGLPAAAMEGEPGSDSYVFTFTQPPPGLVSITWNEACAIFDLAGNPFDTEAPRSSWSYLLEDTVAPEVRERTPVADALVGRLPRIEVIFNEPVAGVEAADLLVNGQPATALTGMEAGPYVFEFAQPSSGTVQFAWAAEHQITDTSPAANRFGGGTWTVRLDTGLAPGDVIINEVVAGNETGLRDENGEAQDWIEILNRGPWAVDLLGWSLTDDPDTPGKWTFPSKVLQPGALLVVFASSKDRRSPTGSNRFHTNFKLSVFGEYLALYNAESPRVAVAEFAPAYPEQRDGYSYGLSTTGSWAYFQPPTPGAANGQSAIVGVAPSPHFSVGRGTFDAPFNLVLTAPLEGATIRYTTDGSEPTIAAGLAYAEPIRIERTTTLRAATFGAGYLPSRTCTQSYLFLEDVVNQPANPAGFPTTWGTRSGFPNNQIPADYEMDHDPLRVDPLNPASPLDPGKAQRLRQGLRDLPLVSIVMSPDDLFGPQGLYPQASDSNKTPNEKRCSVEMILPDGSTAFVIDGGLDLHGNASRSPLKNPKHGFKLTFKGDYGPTALQYRLFPDSPAEEFDDLILRPDFNSSWRHWSDVAGNANGAYQRSRGTRTRYAWSQQTHRDMGNIGTHTLYFHLFLNGLYWGTYDFSEQPTETFAEAYCGPSPDGYDLYDQGALRGGTSTAYNAMRAITDLSNLANYERMRQYLDVPEFIDYTLLHFFVGHQDWGNSKNWHAVRPRLPGPAGTFKYIPWDQECILLEENVNRVPNGGGSTDVPSGLHIALDDSPEYRLEFADHVFRHMLAPGGALTTEANIARWRKFQTLLDNAIVAESCRWGDYRRDVHRYSEGAFELYTREDHWFRENERLVNSYFVNRGAIVLDQLRRAGLYPNIEAPQFSQQGGRVPAGFELAISTPAGTVYWTTNGSDPRVYGSGAVSPDASSYQGPIALTRTLTVKARAWQSGTWSALNEATFTVGELGLPLRFTEIMYHPPGGDAFEFLEIQNVGSISVDLGGFSLSGVDFVFPDNSSIQAGAVLIVASSSQTELFRVRYPTTAVFGFFGGSLANGGERLALVDRAGHLVTAVHYDDAHIWPQEADGAGFSLECIDPRGDPNAPANWRASDAHFGTPGLPPSQAAPPPIVLNEVMADNVSAVPQGNRFPDYIELHNPGAAPVNLGQWTLTDDSDQPPFVFPPDTSIEAGAYLVVWCDSDSSVPGLHAAFGLGRKGDTVALYGPAGERIDAVTFGLQVPDCSIGRVGGLWCLTHPTPQQTNVPVALASSSQVALNEWLANPQPGGDDWIELYNRSAMAPVALRGLYVGTSEALHRISSLSFLAPQGYAQWLADENPGPDHLDFKLPASGGQIALYDETGLELERFSYGPQDSGVSEGRMPDGTGPITVFQHSASPGASNYLLDYAGPVLNEFLARNRRAHIAPWGDYADWIELFNPGPAAVDMQGMALGRLPSASERWVFPAGTSVPAGGYLLVWCDDSLPASVASGQPLNTGFALDGVSGGVVLFNQAGQPVDTVEYGFQVADLSVGRNGEAWNLLAYPTPGHANADAAALDSADALRINEWMADPASGEDWFEIFNPSNFPVSMSGLFVSDSPAVASRTNNPVAPLSFIGGGKWVRFEADENPAAGFHHVRFRLDRLGGTLRLYNTDLTLIDSVDYGLQTAGVSQGRLPDGTAHVVFFTTTPSPGAANYLPLTDVVINEVLSHTDPPYEDAIEIHNPTETPVNLGGWYLSDTESDPKRYCIPSDTIVAPGGYHVFYQADFGPADGDADAPPLFSLNAAHGDAVYLSATDASGDLTGYRQAAVFGAAANGVSFGRQPTSAGTDFVAMSHHTFGADIPADVDQFRTGGGSPNSGPLVGPVVISELMVQPPADSGITPSLTNLEFVELLNISTAPVDLFDTKAPANVWRLANAVSFRFPPNTTIQPGGCLVVVPFDPASDTASLAAFQAAYLSTATLVGPYAGKLSNSGESVELCRPDSMQQPPQPDAGYVPYILVDRVAYSNAAPWPTNILGSGLSFQRVSPAFYGNEPTNWTAAIPTPGRPFSSTDSDGDGLPDDWEREHGTDPARPDAGEDPDRDGMTNAAEYFAGTDPRSELSRLYLEVVAIGSDTVALQFPAMAHRTYRVLYQDALTGPPWLTLEAVPASSADRMATVVDAAPSPASRFYRVVTP